MELRDVAVPELEPLRLVDRHHAHRVRAGVGRARLLPLALVRDIAAQAAQDDLNVDVLGLERGAQVAEEAGEVRDAVCAQVARGLGRLQQRERAQLLDEDVDRVAGEARAQRRDRGDGVAKRIRPALDALEARHVIRQLRRGAGDLVVERRQAHARRRP